MSHELRTPLNAILGFSEMLTQQYFGPLGSSKYHEYAEDIYNSGSHLLKLVNDLLDISTIESGSHSIQKEPISIKETTSEAHNMVRQRAIDKGVLLSAYVTNDIPDFLADLRALKQILLNLLTNAINYTPTGGEISITANANSREAIFIISDTGIGIAADRLDTISSPFVQSEHNPQVTDKGWGLGLSITRSLVELHGGKLHIDSVVGQGTTVTVTLPNSANAVAIKGHPKSV